MPVRVDLGVIATSRETSGRVPLVLSNQRWHHDKNLAAGAVPLLPRALAYPEVIPGDFHHLALYEPGALTSGLRSAIEDLEGRRRDLEGLPEAMQRFDWSRVAAVYDDAVDELVDAGPISHG